MSSEPNPFADPFSDPSVTSATAPAKGGAYGGTGDASFNPFESSGTSGGSSSSYGMADNRRSSDKRPILTSSASPKSTPKEVELKPAKPSSSSPSTSTSSPLSSTGRTSAYATSSGLTEDDLRIREENLLRREQELADRERDIDQRIREGKLLRPDNWPSKCYALEYHSIQDEIPEQHRVFVRKCYAALYLTWLCIFFNWFTLVIGWLINSSGDSSIAGSDCLWSSIYLVLGLPGSWKLWYRSIYYAFRDNATGKWVVFFLSYLAHIAFAILMGLGVPSCAAAGLFMMFKLFGNHQNLSGIFSLVATIIWGINVLCSIYLLKKAHSLWKAGGGQADLQKQVAKAAAEGAIEAKLAEEGATLSSASEV